MISYLLDMNMVDVDSKYGMTYMLGNTPGQRGSR